MLIHLTGYGKETPVEAQQILYERFEYARLPVFQRLMGCMAVLAEVYFAHKHGVAGQKINHMAFMTIKTNVELL